MFIYESDYVEFEIDKGCTIWGIGGHFADASASTGQPLRLSKKDDTGSYIVLGDYPTASNDRWYKLFRDLQPGIYKMQGTAMYSGLQEMYGEINSVFIKLSDNWSVLTPSEKKALFESTNYETASAEDLATLGKFKILTYAEMENKSDISLTAVPKDQLVLPKGLIITGSFEGIDKATLTNTVSGNGVCKLLVTNDLRAYRTYDFTSQEWQVIDHTDLATVKSSGIAAAELANINRAAWDKITTGKQGIGFAYLLSIEDTSDVCSVDNLNLTVDMKGSWDKAIHGADYTYGYPANNVLKVILKSNGDYKINYSEGAKEI